MTEFVLEASFEKVRRDRLARVIETLTVRVIEGMPLIVLDTDGRTLLDSPIV